MRTDHHQHHQGADQGQKVAQGDRDRSSQQALDDLDVRRQARQDFAGGGRQEEGWIQGQYVGIGALAQIGDDPFTQLGDKEISKGRGQGQGDGDAPQKPEPRIDRRASGLGSSQVVDQGAHGAREPQGRRRRRQQEDSRHDHVAHMRRHEGQKPAQRTDAAPLGPSCCAFRDLLGQGGPGRGPSLYLGFARKITHKDHALALSPPFAV